jgi:hypothetical protein
MLAARQLLKPGLYVLIVALVLTCAWIGQVALLGLTLAIGSRGAFELYGALRPHSAAFRAGLCFSYMILGVALICFAIVLPPASVVYVYLVVVVLDAVSRVARGRLKGAAGGAVAAMALAVVMRAIAGLSIAEAIVAGASLIAAGFAGELSASWVKRHSGIRNFGWLLPGHEGVLDRFDRLLFAAPVALMVLH